MRRFAAALLAGAMVLALSACGGDPDTARESIQVIAMDTVMIISTYGKHSVTASYAVQDMIVELEAELSRTAEDSDVSRLNNAGGGAVEIGWDTYCLLEQAASYSTKTRGAFDITIAPVVSAWGFTADSFQVPSREELDGLLELADPGGVSPVRLDAMLFSASLGPGQSIDLGGIAKGYTTDKITFLFRQYEVPRGLAQLGGNVLAWGDRPDGTPWRIGVQDPAKPDDQTAFVGVLNLTNAFAVTSGGYQRYFEQDGKTYHHIIDPATGCPADSGLTSVTVVADCGDGSDRGLLGLSGTMCDALSTALFVMGEEKALDFWRTWNETPFDLVLVTEDGRVLVTDVLADRFTAAEGTEYQYVTVS